MLSQLAPGLAAMCSSITAKRGLFERERRVFNGGVFIGVKFIEIEVRSGEGRGGEGRGDVRQSGISWRKQGGMCGWKKGDANIRRQCILFLIPFCRSKIGKRWRAD